MSAPSSLEQSSGRRIIDYRDNAIQGGTVHEAALVDRVCGMYFCAGSNHVGVGNTWCTLECTYQA